jgi:LPS-assembly protein
VPVFGFGLRSGVERVYDLEKGNWLSSIVDIGADSTDTKLTRLKHTIEPSLQYAYVPEVTQDDLPYFDSTDRYRQRSLVTYGVTSRLFGRMLRPFERSRDVGELAPEAETLPMYDLSTSVLQFGRGSLLAPVKNIDPRPGEVRELASISLLQTYNYNPYTDPAATVPTEPLSDLAFGFTVSPSAYFTTGLQSNFTTQDNRFSSFAMSAGLRDDREDVARLRYSFLDGSASQVEGNLEAKLAEQLRLGYYARYDIRESQMFESRGLIRFINSCRCWSLDLGVGSQLQPSNRQFLLTFTFAGLGDINQSVGLSPQQNQQQAAP